MKVFQLNCEFHETKYRFQINFEEVSMGMKRVVTMSFIFLLRPLSRVVHVNNLA